MILRYDFILLYCCTWPWTASKTIENKYLVKIFHHDQRHDQERGLGPGPSPMIMTLIMTLIMTSTMTLIMTFIMIMTLIMATWLPPSQPTLFLMCQT